MSTASFYYVGHHEDLGIFRFMVIRDRITTSIIHGDIEYACLHLPDILQVFNAPDNYTSSPNSLG
jgi:hypothetical protein